MRHTRPLADGTTQERGWLHFSRITVRRFRALAWPLAATLGGLALFRHLAAADREGRTTLSSLAWLVTGLRRSGGWLLRSSEGWSWVLLGAVAAVCLALAALAVRRGGDTGRTLRGLTAAPLALLAVLALGTGHPLAALAAGALLAVDLASGSPSREAVAPPWATAALVGVVLAALVLRCFALASWPPGYPEHAVVHHTSLSLPFYEKLGPALRAFDLGGLRQVAAAVVHDQHGPEGLVAAVGFAVLGVTLTATQLTTAALGVLGVLAAYFFGRVLESWRTGLVLAVLTTASPWNVSISRYADAEHVLAPLVAFTSLGLLLRALDSHRRGDAVLAAAALGLSWYVYAPVQVVPVLAALVTALHALYVRPWTRRGVLTSLLALVTFAAVSAPALADFWARGRLIPIRTSYEEDRGAALLDPARVLALSGLELRQLFVKTSDPWFDRSGGGLGATEAALLLPGLALIASRLKAARARDRSVLLLTAVPLSFLPGVFAPDESFRRLFLCAAFVLVIAAAAIAGALEAAAQAGGSRIVLATAIGAAAFGYTAVNTRVYFDDVDVHESSSHIYHRGMADLVAAELGRRFTTIVVGSESEVADPERYVALAGYEKLASQAAKGQRVSDLYRVVPAAVLAEPGRLQEAVARGGLLVAEDSVLTGTEAGRELAAALRDRLPVRRIEHHGERGPQPWTVWELGEGSEASRPAVGGGLER